MIEDLAALGPMAVKLKRYDMKKTILALFCVLVLSGVSLADDVTLPYNVVVSEPLTDKVERISVSFFWEAAGNYALIKYELWNSDRTGLIEENVVRLEGTSFNDFVADYGATLQSRSNVAINQHIQANHTTQAK